MCMRLCKEFCLYYERTIDSLTQECAMAINSTKGLKGQCLLNNERQIELAHPKQDLQKEPDALDPIHCKSNLFFLVTNEMGFSGFVKIQKASQKYSSFLLNISQQSIFQSSLKESIMLKRLVFHLKPSLLNKYICLT